MKYRVVLLSDAREDLFEIYNYVAINDSVNNAEKLIDNLENTCLKLSQFPHRGHIPPELDRIEVHDYLEIHYKPYRAIYQIIGTTVFVNCILDGRRDLSELLQKRLLR